MIIEDKTNINDAIVQIAKAGLTDQNLYTRVGKVIEKTDATYTIEMLDELFDDVETNEKNYIYEVENVTQSDINLNAYVFLTYLSIDYPVIFASTNSNDITTIYATTLVELSGATAIIKAVDEIDILTDDGANINMTDKIIIENSNENLNDLLQDLISEIQKISVATPSGTSGYPLNLAAIATIGTKLNTLLQ